MHGGEGGVAIQRAFASEGIRRFVVFVGSLVVFLAVAAIFGVIAAIIPARRAARLDILSAISYE